MLPLRLMFDVHRAGYRSPPREQLRFLNDLDVHLRQMARFPVNCIQEITENDVYATHVGARIGDVRPTSDFLYDLGADYLRYLKHKDREAFVRFLRENVGAEQLRKFEETNSVTMNFNTNSTHPMNYYGFMNELPSWKRLEKKMGSMGIQSAIYAAAPDDDRHQLFVGLKSGSSAPLRLLVKQRAKKTGDPLDVAPEIVR